MNTRPTAQPPARPARSSPPADQVDRTSGSCSPAADVTVDHGLTRDGDDEQSVLGRGQAGVGVLGAGHVVDGPRLSGSRIIRQRVNGVRPYRLIFSEFYGDSCSDRGTGYRKKRPRCVMRDLETREDDDLEKNETDRRAYRGFLFRFSPCTGDCSRWSPRSRRRLRRPIRSAPEAESPCSLGQHNRQGAMRDAGTGSDNPPQSG
jgi:hypothetical protein